MKVTTPDEKCLLLHGQYDLAQKSAAFIAVTDVFNESLLSFPNAIVMYDSVANGFYPLNLNLQPPEICCL
jgi:hypothetical protein